MVWGVRARYWTDNGGWFHYPPFNATGEYQKEWLLALKDAKAAGIPFGHWQGDSWWYPKGPGGTGSSQEGHYGVYRWIADPFVFPLGMAKLQEEMQLPAILHNRWMTENNWYKANHIPGKGLVDRVLSCSLAPHAIRAGTGYRRRLDGFAQPLQPSL